MKANRIVMILSLFAVSVVPLFAAPPALINYQGRLADGANLVNGQVALSLRLFNGSNVMVYEDSNTVTVVDGLYATLLGDNTIFGDLATALTNAEVWIEVAVNGVALSPRERMVSVAYALNTSESDPLWSAQKEGFATGTPVYVEADPLAVKKTGDTMTGPLVINNAASGGILIGSTGSTIAIGTDATGTGHGLAVGRYANGEGYGAAFGYYADGSSQGAAVGYAAQADWYGASAGSLANGTDYGAALGYRANAAFEGVAIGKMANGVDGNIAIGESARAVGQRRIAIGESISNQVDDSAAVRGTLYLDGATGIYYRTTFGSGAWLNIRSGLATGTPVYVETDPVWLAQKSAYATGTPLYAYTETDPVYLADKASLATGTPVYAETDPLYSADKPNIATGTPVYVESDPLYSADKPNIATGTPLYAFTELDPVWAAEKGSYLTSYTETDPVAMAAGFLTNYVETDPVWEAQKANYLTNFIETDPIWEAVKGSYVASADVHPTKVLYVDAGRTNVYVEDGTILKPYKTITGALAVAPAGSLVRVAPGTYTEDLAVPADVTLIGSGQNATKIVGNVTAGAHAVKTPLRDFWLDGTLLIQGDASIANMQITKKVTVNAGYVNMYNVTIQTVAGDNALVWNSTGNLLYYAASIGNSGNYAAVLQTAGMVTFVGTEIRNSSASVPALVSTNGNVFMTFSQIMNLGGGAAANINNGAGAAKPNGLVDCIAAGNVQCGSAVTIIEGVRNLAGSLSGTALSYRNASQIGNDSSIAGATVKDALNTMTNYLTSYTETDPVWAAEKAAYATGTPVYAETDPNAVLADGSRAMTGDLDMGGNSITNVAGGSIVFEDGTAISAAGVGNWNTAYGWGNHATGGYATAASLTAASNSLQAQVSQLVSTIPLWQGGHSATIGNTSGEDLQSYESALIPTVYQADGKLQVKLVVRLKEVTGTAYLQIRTHNGTTETYPIVYSDMSYTPVQSGQVGESSWKDFDAGTSPLEVHLFGWVSSGGSMMFDSAYLLVRADSTP